MRADMSDALDRVVPEDRKGGLYRHDAEGRDDMPVCGLGCMRGGRGWDGADEYRHM